MSEMATVASIEELDMIVSQNEGLLLIECWTEWCTPCKISMRTLEELQSQKTFSDRCHILKLNIEAVPQVIEIYTIRAVPTILLFMNSALVDKLIGLQPKKSLMDIVEVYSKNENRG